MTSPSLPLKESNPFYHLAGRLWPGLEDLSVERQVIAIGDIFTALYALPLGLIGLAWLVSLTNLSLVTEYWIEFLAIGLLIGLLRRLNFFLIVELRDNRYGSADGSLDSTILWSALLLFGPTALWFSLFWVLVDFLRQWRQVHSPGARWNRMRGFSLEVATNTLNYLIGLNVYLFLGGQIPITGLNLETFSAGIVAIVAAFIVMILTYAGYILYGIRSQILLSDNKSIRPILWFFLLVLGLPVLAQPLGIIMAGLWVESGVFVFALLTIGLLIVAFLTRQLSWVAESSRQQSRMLEKLEGLGRAFMTTPPGLNNLTQTVNEQMPNMFPSRLMAIWTFPADIMYQNPDDWQPDLNEISAFLAQHNETASFLSRDPLPWEAGTGPHNPVIVTPIHDAKSDELIGGIYIELRTLALQWGHRNLALLYPAIQSLADQIASAIHQTDLYAQTLDYQKVSQELRFAGQIQASLLPFRFPSIPGWELAVTLDPVGETSGDFFDIIPLSEDRLGLVIADVADKGVGPALYMALSRTLIRTYATEFDEQPDIVFFAANERILKDTDATNLFVTAFYGILDLKTGELTYANAGHNPPYLFVNDDDPKVLSLTRTGIPIGVEEEVTWGHASIKLEKGDILILYTDGVPDAQNTAGQFFGEEALVQIGIDCQGISAEKVQRRIIDAIYEFTGEAPQFDDITLIVLIRND